MLLIDFDFYLFSKMQLFDFLTLTANLAAVHLQNANANFHKIG